MRYAEAMRALEAASDPKIAEIYRRRQPGVHTIGVRFGDLDRMAQRIGTDHDLAMRLWDSGVLDARFLAAKTLDPTRLTKRDVNRMVAQLDHPALTDLFAGSVYRTRWAEEYMRRWAASPREFVRRAGYALLHDLAAANDGAIDEPELVDRLATSRDEIHASPNWSRETMNMVPIAIGKTHPALADVALATAEAYGTVEVFHGDKTNAVWNAAEALRDPRVKVPTPPPRARSTASRGATTRGR